MSSKHNIRYKSATTAPQWMRNNAKQGLEWVRDGKAGDGVTEKTKREARDMASGIVTVDKAMRMAAWFARHMGDLSSPDAKRGAGGFPSPGIVAHALWGGGSATDSRRAKAWAAAFAEKKYKQLGGDGSPPNYKVLLITHKHLGNLHNELSHGTWSKGSVSWGLAGQVRRRLGGLLGSPPPTGGGGSATAVVAVAAPKGNVGSWTAKDMKLDTPRKGGAAVPKKGKERETSVMLTTSNQRRRDVDLVDTAGNKKGSAKFDPNKVDAKRSAEQHILRVRKDFDEYMVELQKIKGVTVLSKSVGYGDTPNKWGKEPTFVVRYKGDGDARRLAAKFALGKQKNNVDSDAAPQDAMVIARTVGHKYKPAAGNWHETNAIPRITLVMGKLSAGTRAKIDAIMSRNGITGWTWSREGNRTTLRMDWLEQYAGNQTTRDFMDAANRVAAQVPSRIALPVVTRRESVTQENWGSDDYQRIIDAKTIQQPRFPNSTTEFYPTQ